MKNKLPINLGYLCRFHQIAQRYKRHYGRKFAQSGHPGFRPSQQIRRFLCKPEKVNGQTFLFSFFQLFHFCRGKKIIEMASMRSKVILDKENRKILGADTIVVLILL
jgi:hypothetical protein